MRARTQGSPVREVGQQIQRKERLLKPLSKRSTQQSCAGYTHKHKLKQASALLKKLN